MKILDEVKPVINVGRRNADLFGKQYPSASDRQNLKNKQYVTILSAPIRRMAYPDRRNSGWLGPIGADFDGHANRMFQDQRAYSSPGHSARLMRRSELCSMTIIPLVRHGHVEGIKPERFRGRADLALTETGQRQAELLARRIASYWAPSAIFTSPLLRCVTTGAAVAKACGVPFASLSELCDIDYGAWQSLAYDDAREKNPDLFAAWFTTPDLIGFPGGESLQDVAARTASVLRFILSRKTPDTLVLVGHDSVNRVLFDLSSEYAAISLLAARSKSMLHKRNRSYRTSFQLRRMNDTAHLDIGIN